MENKNIFWGILLVAIGALFILDNMDLVNFSFSALISLWPLLLVVWGISLLPFKGIYKTVLALVIAAFALVYASTSDRSSWWEDRIADKIKHARVHVNHSSSNDDEDENSEEESFYTFQFDEEDDSAITEGKLTMDVAAGKFRIDDVTNEHIIDFEAYSNIGPYTSNMVSNGNNADIQISLDDAFIKNGTTKNRASIKLNPKVDWNMHLNIGAADFRGDLRKFKVSKIDIDGGASSINLKIGELQNETNIKLDAGAASIKIEIPENASCKIISDSFLVDMDLDGFTKDEDGNYLSNNYSETGQHILIDVDAAISQLRVQRYHP